jgi:DNA repair protein RadD
MRLFDGKSDCLVADFVGNSDRHGPIDEIEGRPPRSKGTGDAPIKMCDECFSVVLAGLKICPVCGHEFEFHAKAEQTFDPNTGLLISGVIKNEDGTRTYPVTDVSYEVRTTKTGAPALVVNYLSAGRSTPVASEYLNMWHHNASAAQRDSMKWLRRQAHAGGSVPLTAGEALARAELGALRKPKTVTIKKGSAFPVKFT